MRSSVWDKVERADIGKAPGLIGPSRHRQTLELRPRGLLLIAKPGGQPVVRAIPLHDKAIQPALLVRALSSEKR